MEVTFSEVRDLSNNLTQEQRTTFPQHMGEIVVLIQAASPLENPTPQEVAKGLETIITGGGVLVDEDGTILTAAHILPSNPNPAIMCRLMNGHDFFPAEIVKIDHKSDLGLIRIVQEGGERQKFSFCQFGDEYEIRTSLEVFALGHPCCMPFQFTKGNITCPRRRADESIKPATFGPQLREYHKDLPLIQIGNFHCEPGSSGSAVFNSMGHVIGVMSFIALTGDYAIHLSAVKRFIETDVVIDNQGGQGSKSKSQSKRNKKRIAEREWRGGKGGKRGRR